MLVNLLLAVALLLIQAIFALLDVLPNLPDSAVSVINSMFGMMQSGIGIFGLFVDIRMVKILFPIVIAIMNFDKIYWLVMWILKKIPFIDIN